MVIAARNPVHSVLFLILAFVNAAGLFVLLGAEFAFAWSQPVGPPGPSLRSQLLAFLRGLFVAPRDESETFTSERSG